jgi:hypothetical protein
MQEHTPHTQPSSPPTRIKTTHGRSWRACLIVAALALLGGALSARHARAASSCINVSRAMQIVPNTNPIAATVTGDLAGTIRRVGRRPMDVSLTSFFPLAKSH